MAATVVANAKTTILIFKVIFCVFLDYATFALAEPCPSACHCLGSMVDCSEKGLIYVPKDLPKWVATLDLQNNALTDIHAKDFVGLRNLETLKLGKNQISFINETVFQQIPNLKTLSLNHNKFTEIPYFNKNSSMTHLSINHNRIHSLDGDSLYNTKKLRTLDLSYNFITDISVGVFPSNNSLHQLLLNNNKMVSIQANALNNLTVLEWLRLSKNKISLLPKNTFSALKRLKTLEMNRNKLRFIPGLMFNGSQNLVTLKLHKNQISGLGDGAFYGLQRIHSLMLDQNNITQVQKKWLYGLDSLQQLSLSHNKVATIQSWEFCKLLQQLDLTYNSLTSLHTQSFKDLTKLRTLNLDYNHISHIANDAFRGLHSLQLLTLSNNQAFWTIEDSSGAFIGLYNLKRLNLRENHIKSIAKEAFSGLKALQQIDLSGNNITSLEDNIFSVMTDLNEIKFNSSNLLCDCSLSWLPMWLKATGHKGTVKAVCAHPEWLRGKSVFAVDRDDFKCKDFPKPMMMVQPSSQITLKDQNVTVECEAVTTESYPIKYQWRKNDIIIVGAIMKNEATQVDDIYKYRSRLYLNHIQDSDAGSYQCVVTNRFGSAYSRRVDIAVHVFPRFIKRPNDINVKAGKHARLECAAVGSPAPVISWQKDGGVNFPAARERRIQVIPNDHVYFIVPTKAVDEGVYSCMATNAAGTIVSNATITISEVPIILHRIDDKVTRVGKTTVLECMAGGNPKPLVKWSKDQRPLRLTPRHFFAADHQLLIIIQTMVSDAGRYTCTVSNTLGYDSDSATLTVVGADSSLGHASPGPRHGHLGVSQPLLNQPLQEDDNETSSDSTTAEITIIVVVCCVVGTSLVWVIIIYQTRIKNDDYTTSTDEKNLPVDGQSSCSNSSHKDTNYTSSQYQLAGYLYPDHHSKESGYDSSEGRVYATIGGDYKRCKTACGFSAEEMHQYTPLIVGDVASCHHTASTPSAGHRYSESDSASLESSLSTGSTHMSSGDTLRTFRPLAPSVNSSDKSHPPESTPHSTLTKYPSASTLTRQNHDPRGTSQEFYYSGQPPDTYLQRPDYNGPLSSHGCTIYMNPHYHHAALPTSSDSPLTQNVAGMDNIGCCQQHPQLSLLQAPHIRHNPCVTQALVHKLSPAANAPSQILPVIANGHIDSEETSSIASSSSLPQTVTNCIRNPHYSSPYYSPINNPPPLSINSHTLDDIADDLNCVVADEMPICPASSSSSVTLRDEHKYDRISCADCQECIPLCQAQESDQPQTEHSIVSPKLLTKVSLIEYNSCINV